MRSCRQRPCRPAWDPADVVQKKAESSWHTTRTLHIHGDADPVLACSQAASEAACSGHHSSRCRLAFWMM